MTSQIGKSDVEDQLYLLGPNKPHQRKQAMRVIELYAHAVAQRMLSNLELMENKHRHLMPGDTDITEGVRKCAKCLRVLNLASMFDHDHRAPNGHKLRCIECVPPTDWPAGKTRADRYECRKCLQWLPLSKFPMAKQRNPRIRAWCAQCKSVSK